MVEEIATVVACDDGGLWLSTTPVSSCNACQVSDDCGTGIVAKTLTPRQQQFFVASELKLLPGEQVKIGLAEPELVKAALMVYLLPIVLLLGFALLAATVTASEGLLLLAGLVGAAVGFGLARYYDQKQANHQKIQILAVLPTLGVQPAQG